MSGFDAGWLDLREPADHRALAEEPLAALVAFFRDRETVSVTDLGAGSGSMLRALAPRLPSRQSWTLVDQDRALLDHARERLSGWADEAEQRGDCVALRKGPAEIAVATEIGDLAQSPLPASAAAADLVTASAFFDLVSLDWLNAFVAELAAARRPLYAPLVYFGLKTFQPEHVLDGPVLGAFNRHQGGDKGFGPALGLGATAALAGAASHAGYRCVMGASPWRLGPQDHGLVERLVADMARAVAETDDPPQNLDAWLAHRLEAAPSGAAQVIHVDLFLVPPSG